MIRHSRRYLCVLGLVVAGLRPTPAAQSIQTIEINQGMGVQKNGALKFVAGKDTVVRAFLTAPATIDPEATSATITRDGVVVTTLAPNTYADATSVVDFQCPNRAACGNWAAGSYVFEVQVNGSTASTAGTTFRFVERAKLRVLALPVRANYNGTIQSVTGESWKSLWEFTRNVYPIAADGIDWTIRQELDGSAFDLETDEGKKALWDALADLNPPHCTANRQHAGCFDKIIGFIQSRYNTFPNGTGQGYTFGSPANIAVASDEDAAATVAHEIAHNFGIGDAYNGGSFACRANPTPDAFSGTDFDTQEAVRCTAGRVALPGVGGTLVPAAHHPYEVGGRGALPDVAEYMGSGGLQSQFWASQDTWDWIFDRLVPTAAADRLRSARHDIRPTSAIGDATQQRLLVFSGFIRRNPASRADVELDPWDSFLDDEDIRDTTGPLMIAALDAAGQRVATTRLDVRYDLPGGKGEPAVHLAQAPFEGVIRFPFGVTRFQILNGSVVVREVPVSAHTPIVSNVSLGVGSVFNGVTALSWTGRDDDGDALSYTVEYNPDVNNPDGYFEEVVSELRDPRLTLDFGELPGGAHARIRIIATDGIHTAYNLSPEFRVPFKEPDVFIDPPEQTVVPYGEEIWLDAEAADLQDGLLADSALVWSSNLSGRLGTGELLSISDLPPGEHTITLTATNSGGVSARDSIRVTVQRTRGRYKIDGDRCYFAPNDDGPDQCQPGAPADRVPARRPPGR